MQTLPYFLEITPRSGRTFHQWAESREAAMAEFDRQCELPNRVWVGVCQVLDGVGVLVRERNLWEEQQAAKGAPA